MKRLNDNEIVLTNEELENIREFIRSTLRYDWDHHTSLYYGCKETDEEGMSRMDPEMYNMSQEMDVI